MAAAPARAQWSPPIGIPSPSFGIFESARPSPNPWTVPTPGYYFVEASRLGATNQNNPYGTPAKPRSTIPNVLPAGSVVELHGTYDQLHLSPANFVSQGTSTNPVFIRGASSSARPLIRRDWEVSGNYFILENLEFGPTPDSSTTGALIIRAPTSHLAIRHSELHGTLTDGGLAVENWTNGSLNTDNVVVYHNVVHDNGDVNATFDQDVHGMHVGDHVNTVWIVDNEMYGNSGDGLQINASASLAATTHHIYVGRNVSHHNKQGGFWVKQATDVIFSQNLAYAHRPGNSSLGHCLGAQYGPDYVWWIYNRAFDCEFGIAQMSDGDDGQRATHTFFIGNVIWNIHETTLTNPPDDPWGPAGIMMAGGFNRHVVNNTIFDVDSGVNTPSPFGTLEITNNIISNVTPPSGFHVNVGFQSLASQTTFHHNLLYLDPRVAVDGTAYHLSAADLAALQSTGSNPLFANAAAHNFHISPNSPATASGQVSAVYGTFQQRYGLSILVDADGSPRPQVAAVDIGAFSSNGWGTLVIDSPASDAVVGSSFVLSGWAIDRTAPTGSGIDAIHVYLAPSGGVQQFLGVATYGGTRGDIGSLFGAQFSPSGYTLSVSGLSAGAYTLTVYGHSSVTGTFNVSASRSFTVSGPVSRPAMTLDSPSNNGTSGKTVTIAGWAIDQTATSGTGVDTVHVWAFPSGGGPATFLGVANYGLSRPDIGGAFGIQFANSGFRLAVVVPEGNYTINAYMHSTVANAFNAAVGAVNVTVNTTDSNAVVYVDTPAQNAVKMRPFPISGWAVDSGAPTGTGIDAIHVWAFPTNGAPSFLVGAASYGLARPDIGTLFGNSRFTNSGLTFTVTSANVPNPGTYDFYVFGRSTVTGGFTVARIVRVTVQ